MWDNAQRDGRPAEYRWRPLFNAAKFGWRPILECRAVMLPRRETRWNLQGNPKLANRSQPLVGQSSPYYEDIWRRYCCLTSFFSDCRYMRRYSPTKFAMVLRWRLLGDFLRAIFLASLAQHVSDVHSKFTLRPHRVWKYGRHPISDRWDYVRKKEEETTGWKYIWPALLHRAAIKQKSPPHVVIIWRTSAH